MTGMLTKVKVVIADAGVFISLAHGDLLGLLLEFAEDVNIVTTDIVAFEVTRRADLFDAKRVADLFSANEDRIKIVPTGYGDILKVAKENPAMSLPKNMGESSIYGFVNDIRGELRGIPTLVIFEDNWFSKNELGVRPTMMHLISLAAFLKYAEVVVPNFSFESAVAQITHTRPGVNLIEIDSPGKNSATNKETV